MAKVRFSKASAAPQPAAAEAEYDPFQAVGARSKFRFENVVVWPYLAGVFFAVWLVVLYLMAPSFATDYTRYMSMYYASSATPEKSIPYLEKLRQADFAAQRRTDPKSEPSESPTFTRELGTVYGRLGKWDEALGWLQKAQAARANTASDDTGKKLPSYDFSTDLGVAYMKLGRMEEAEKSFLDALKFDKLDASATFFLGELAMEKGDIMAAVNRFKAVTTDPRFRERVKENYRKIEERISTTQATAPAPTTTEIAG